jgi:hypothetical protein
MAGAHLYIIQSKSTGAVKIGKSDDPARRLRQLQTGCPHVLKIILLLNGGGDLETYVHQIMRRHRTRHDRGGEWFNESGMGDIPDEIWAHVQTWYLEDPDWWKRQ